MRAFIAVDVPCNSDIEALMNHITKYKNVKVVERENLHITIKFLGEVSKLDDILACIKRIEFKKFRISLKGVGAFPSMAAPRVIWIGVEEGKESLSKLMVSLDRCLEKVGFRREDSYVPHLTVARLKERQRIDLSEYLNKEFGTIEVKEIKLKKSTLTPSGPIYEDIYVHKLQE